MDERSRKIFEKYQLKIYKQVEPRDVIAELQILNIISFADFEKIQSLPTQIDRAHLFVNRLPQKLVSLSQLVDVLREARYTTLANEIDVELNGLIADPEQHESTTKEPLQLRQTQSAAGGIGVPHQRPIRAEGGVQPASTAPDRCEPPIPAHQQVTSQKRAASARNLEENLASRVQASGRRAQVDERGIKFLDVVWGKFKQLTTSNPIQNTQTRAAKNNLVSAMKVDASATVAQNTVGKKATLDQFVKKLPNGTPYMHMDVETLSKLTGTEIFSSGRTDIDSWRYFGNGEELQKFYKLISHNPDVTPVYWFHITGETIHERRLQVPGLPMIKRLFLNLECQVSSSSATNIELILSELKPALSNLLDFYIWSDSGQRFPKMRRLLQQIPSSIDRLGFRGILLSEDDISAVVETYEEHLRLMGICAKLVLITLGPTDSTVQSFIRLVQKIKFCSTIKVLQLWDLKLSPENEKKFLREVKTWNHLEYLHLLSGELHGEGQSKLEGVIEILPNLKEVTIWTNSFSVPNEDSLKNVCTKNNVAQNTVGKKATLYQFVKKNSYAYSYMHMDVEALSKLTGTETFSSVRTDIRSWRYYGNGKDLQKFFKLISHNPQGTEHCGFNITGEVIYEHPLQVPDLPMIKVFYLNLQCQMSSSSATNIELILSELKPALSNLFGFHFSCDNSGRSFPGMRKLLQQIPSSIVSLGFRDILLSEDDISAIVESYENRGKLVLITLRPTDSTVESIIRLVQKIKHCSTIKYLSFWGLKLTPENKRKFLREVKTWNHLEFLCLANAAAELHEEGQSELEAVIETLSVYLAKKFFGTKQSLAEKCLHEKLCLLHRTLNADRS